MVRLNPRWTVVLRLPNSLDSMEKHADDTYPAVSEAAKEPCSENDISFLPHQHDELELACLVAPTEEEMNTLRHVPDKIDWAAYSECFICIVPSIKIVAASL